MKKLKQLYYKSIFRKLYLYLRYHKEINQAYGYNLKEGFVGDETYNWIERTNYWLRLE